MSYTSSKIDYVQPVSVVIPTLGGESLKGTIEQINRGKIVPKEILICIPEEDAYKTENFSFSNVRVVKTRCKGQVAQRAEGLKLTSGFYVMQLDDDIELLPETLGRLISALSKLGRGNVIGPVYKEKNTGRIHHKIESGISGFGRNVFYSLICGANWGSKRMGTFTPSGHGFGVDPDSCNTDLFLTQYLPGGCVLSFKEDLVEEDFFPFTGKAYCEDFIHSHLRTLRGIKHWVLLAAECLLEEVELDFNPVARKSSARARGFFIKLRGHSMARFTIYEAVSRVRYFFR